jgi:hypothetical protein
LPTKKGNIAHFFVPIFAVPKKNGTEFLAQIGANFKFLKKVGPI